MSKLEEKKMTKYFLIFILLFTGSIMPQDFELARKLYQEYDNYKEPTIIHRRFKHADIVPLIEQLKNKNIFTVKKAGESAEGREIYLITAGTGEIKVFLWSQMHGDEPTATMALFDIFNFFNSDDFSALKEELFSNLTLYFMPMVNPDGQKFINEGIFLILI
jgi:murein tripeptide amidase MpaA